MSAMRIHRLRALAVQKLAQAYRMDEVASSVMVMQGGTVFDDLAQRVLKVDPSDVDAKYIHFFHEKIPSRQLAECTTTHILDELIAMQPQRLEYYRTRGIVHCFRDEFPQAIKDFTYALKEARAVRKAKLTHRNNGSSTDGKTKPNNKKKGSSQSTGSDTEKVDHSGWSSLTDSLSPHPSTLPDAPEPIEPQLLFLRGSAHLQHAVFLIEEAIIQLEGINRHTSFEGAELRLCHLDMGRYGGVEVGNPDGPLGKTTGLKATAYREVLSHKAFSISISNLLQRSIRDHEKFVGHFDTVETAALCEGNLAQRTEYAFFVSESIRPGNHSHHPRPCSEIPALISAYHPLLVEAHFTILLCLLMLGDFSAVLTRLEMVAALLDGLEACPIFLPPRSMAQAEFVETLERLASGWSLGAQPHSLAGTNGKSRLLLEDASDNRASSSTHPCLPTSSDEGASSYSHCPSPSLPSDEERRTAPYSLDHIRMLLAPVIKRQNQRAEEKTRDDAQPENGKKTPINIPLHGPRVEIILAWLGAVHLPRLEGHQ